MKRYTEQINGKWVITAESDNTLVASGDGNKLKSVSGASIDRLADFENKIERGELIELTSEECSAVRKQAVEECLRILRNIRLQLPRHYGVFWEGWSGAFNAAIRAISQKYAVSVEEECGE